MTAPEPASAEETYTAAQELAVSGRYAEAIEAYSLALGSAPRHVKARVGRGLGFQRLGEHARAIGDFDAAIAEHPDWAGTFVVYRCRAGSRKALGQHAQAIDDCDEALK